MIHVYEISKTASSGAWSGNTLPLRGMIRHILITPPSEYTTFEFKITDEKSLIIYDTKRRETTPIGTLDDELCLPVHGIVTLAVYSASSDGAYTGRLMVEER